MELVIPSIPESRYRLICVANQLLNNNITVDIDIIRCKGQHFKPVECFSFTKDDPYPGGLMLMALGQRVKPEGIWKKYDKSDRILIFVCEPLTKEEEVKVKKVEVTEVPSLL